MNYSKLGNKNFINGYLGSEDNNGLEQYSKFLLSLNYK